MAIDQGDRSEAATPRRRQEARERGQVARSLEVTSAAVLLGTFGALAAVSGHAGQLLLRAFQDGLRIPHPGALTLEAVRGYYLATAWTIGQTVAPILLAGAICGILANLLQVGLLLAPQAMQFNWARLDPLQGLQRILSRRGGVEAAKAVLKIAMLATVAYRTLRPEWEHLPELAAMDLASILRWELGVGQRLAFRVLIAYTALALGDYLYQRWQHDRELRMSKNEVREESRQQEGNPQIRARVRSLQQERARGQMMRDAASASVVVVNPTHIAVAIRYAPGMRAPRVVAKGKRLVAERIVAIAREHAIPVIQDIPLARALVKQVAVGAEIPVAFYRAVARILAYVLGRDRQGRVV